MNRKSNGSLWKEMCGYIYEDNGEWMYRWVNWYHNIRNNIYTNASETSKV